MIHQTEGARAMKTLHARATFAVVATLILFTSAFVAAAAAKQKAYATPEDAVEDFIAAVRNYNLETLVAIFGEESRRVFASEDPVADANQRQEFLRLYDEKHALTRRDDKTQILVAGADPWPFPIPLVKSGAGWTFDTEAGIEEIINRRVGRNELSAIQTCLAAGDAQREYYRRDRDGDGVLEYAQKFRSTVGLRDGLFWPGEEGEPQSPLGEFVATAAAEGYGPASAGYHGYRYRMLTAQGPAAPGGAYDYLVRGDQIGGFAVLAYPEEYGDSGVMTFMVSHDGIVYQKDLGDDTETEANNIKSFNPEGWTKVEKKDLETIPET
jgi:hypothetical protein